MENSISINGAPTPNGHRVTPSFILRLVNVCIAFIALIVSGSADMLFKKRFTHRIDLLLICDCFDENKIDFACFIKNKLYVCSAKRSMVNHCRRVTDNAHSLSWAFFMPILELYRRLPFPQFIPAPAVDYIDLLAKRESAAVLVLQPIGLYSIKCQKINVI